MAKTSFMNRLIHSRLFLVGGVVVLAFVGLAFGRQALRNREIASTINTLQQQANTLSTQNQQIDQLQGALQTETYLEGEARLKLGMMKPGEHVVVVEDSGQPTSDATDPTTDVPAVNAASDETDQPGDASTVVQISNPKRWWDYFFDRTQYNALQADYGN